MSQTDNRRPETTVAYRNGAAGEPPPAAEDPRLTRALEEYLAAQEAGHEPGRQEFLARHPDIAGPLAQCLDGLEFVHAAAPRLQPPVAALPAAAELHAGTTLGDFRILREVGRGGMGIVYEAEQISLGRRVALKVLPFAAALDDKRLQRFKNEAQAAAHLHHTNIVPVFGVGCAQGLHYYAMQYIEGRTLAGIIHELRQLSGLEVPEHASSDVFAPHLAGELSCRRWPQAANGPAPPSTIAGAAQPTVPEEATPATERPVASPAFFRTVAHLGAQAAEALEHAHQLGVIHRDIKPANVLLDARGNLWLADFGLALFHGDAGLTQTGDLLGTLRYMSPEQALAQRGLVDHRTDIYSLGVTLYELLTLQPAFAGNDRQELLRRVTLEESRPPRRLNKAIPPDLETIVLKATAKEVEGRYTTAQEMADDLRRFLKDEPVRARRATFFQRLTKWSRRHPAVVRSAGLLLVMAVVSLATCTVLIWNAQRETERLRRLAEEKSKLAEAKSRLARKAVDEMYGQVDGWLAHTPDTDPLQTKFLSKALALYQEFAREDTTDPWVRWKMGEAEWRVAQIHQRLGHLHEAEGAYVRADALLTELVAGSPSNADYRSSLSNCTLAHAELLAATGRPRKAEQGYLQALAGFQKLAADFPREMYYQHQLGLCHHGLGRFWHSAGRFREADGAFRRAVNVFEKLLGRFPDEPDIGGSLGKADNDWGNLLQYIVLDPQGAAADLPTRGARAVALGMTPQGPSPLAAVTAVMANEAEKHVALQEAEKAYGRAIGLFQDALRHFPTYVDYQWERAIAWHNLGWLYHRTRRAGQAEAAYLQAAPHLQRLVDTFPAIPLYQSTWAGLLYHLALLRRDQGNLVQARQLLENAVGHQQLVFRSNPRDPGYLWEQYNLLGDVLVRLHDHAAASQAAAEWARSFPEDWKALIMAAQNQIRCVTVAAKDKRLSAARRAALARAYGEAARGLLGKAIQQVRKDPDGQNKIAWFLLTCWDAHFRDPAQALELAEQAVARQPQAPNYWHSLGVAHYRLGHWQAAIDALDKEINFRGGADSTDGFFLAMARWQLGDRKGANLYYDRAVLGMRNGMPGEEEARLVRDEASALLGKSERK